MKNASARNIARKIIRLMFSLCVCAALFETVNVVEPKATAVWADQPKAAPVKHVTCPTKSKSAQAQHQAMALKPKTVPSKQVTPAATVHLEGYLMQLRARLMRVWEPTDGKNTVVLEAVVAPNGIVSDIKTSNSGASDIGVQAARMAFEKVEPLPSLPAGVKNMSKLSITFSSTVDPHGDSTSNITTQISPLPVEAGSQQK